MTYHDFKRPIANAIKILGSARALGAKLNPPVTKTAIYKWSRCPAGRVFQVERATGGVITARQLRPDMFPDHFEMTARLPAITAWPLGTWSVRLGGEVHLGLANEGGGLMAVTEEV